MSVSYPACNIDHLKSSYDLVEKHKKKFDPNERDDALKRAAQFEQRMRSASRTYTTAEGMATANKAANRVFMDQVLNQKLGAVNELNPMNRHRVQSFLENYLGIQLGKLGSGGKLSDVGAVRQRLLEARRLGSNYIDLLVDLHRNDSLASLQKTVNNIGKRHNLSQREMSQILIKAREVGAIAQNKVARNIHDAGYAFLEAKYHDFMQHLSDLGFSPDEIDNIMASAHRIYARMDAVRAVAQSMGVDVGNVEGIGYLPRMFQPAATKFIKGAEGDKASALYKEFMDKPNPLMLDYHFQKSRNTSNFIPEDEFLVSTIVGLQPDQLRQMVVDGTLTKWLHKNVNADTLDDLVDTGLLSKVPMFTDEMAHYVISQYGDLPFKELDELLITDPERLYSAYKDALQRAAGDSAMMKTIVEDGMGHGWTATDDMVVRNPEMYKGWEKLTADEIRKYYDAWQGGDVHLHPDVFATFRAVDDLIKSPEKLSTLANIFRNLGGLWIQSALLTPGYVLRNLWTNVISLYASGGNLLRVWEGYGDTAKVLKFGLDALDDTKAVYKMGDKLVTKRRLFEEVFLHVGNNYVPQSSFLKAKKVGFGNPARSIGYLINYSKAHGLIRPAKATDNWFEGVTYALEQLKQTQDVPMSYLARMSQFNENSMKWTTILSRADTSAGNRIGQFLTATHGRALDDFAAEMRAVDNLFFMWDDVGRIPAFTGRYVMPFASVMMKIPPAVVRHAMTNPKKFINYWRVRQFINAGAAQDEDYIDAGVADWKKDSGLLNLYKDPESKNWVGIMTNSFDPISGAAGFWEKTVKNVGAASGVYLGSTETQTRYIKERYDWTQFATEFFRDAPPLNKAVIEWLTQTDLRTGEKKEKSFIQPSPTFLGWRWYSPNPVVNTGLQAIKSILQAYPPTQAFDRANFVGMFGVPEVPNPRDPFHPLVEEKPSLLGKERTEGSLERYYPEMRSVLALALNYAGLPTTVIDQAKQSQVNLAMMKSTLGDIKKDIKKWSTNLYRGDVKDKEELDNIYKQVRFAREVELKLEIANLRLELWMKKHNVPPKDMWNRMKSLGYSDLPPLAQKDADEMAIAYTKQLAADDARYNEVVRKFGGK